LALRRFGRTRNTLFLLVLVSLTIVTLDLSGDWGPIRVVRSALVDVLEPARSLATRLTSPVGDAVGGITGYGELEEENAALRYRIAELEGRELAEAGAAAELSELKELLALDDVTTLPSVAARVVSTPVSNFAQTVELDRGSRHGVAVDLPVVTGAGLVGRVIEVSGSRSTVRLLTDPASAVAVRLPSGASGVAEGRGPGRPLTVDLVDVDTMVGVGDVVLTSGLEGSALPSYFPASLVVGEVVAHAPEPGEQQLDLRVRPAADLDRLAFVRVIQLDSAR
jgi:rod shape-determining protein MreC